MATDIDGYIAKGLELKKAGYSGERVKSWLQEEGVKPEAVSFILAQISKQELKEHAAKGSTAYNFTKGFLGAGFVVGGFALMLHLWSGIEGWTVISTVPFFMIGAGVWILASKN
ncbi:MAG: hypothetical protein WAT74_00245 [Flavobacteriales bacterium]